MLLAMENQQIITSEILAMLIIDLWSRSLITDYVMRNSFNDIFFRGFLASHCNSFSHSGCAMEQDVMYLNKKDGLDIYEGE